MTLILYGILLAHLNAYREQYMNIGITFAVTYLMKRLLRSTSKDHADLIGLGGYALSMKEFVKLMGQVKNNGFQGASSEEAHKFIGGLLGDGINKMMDLFKAGK